MGIDNILGFDWPSPPSPQAMIRALEVLYSLQILDDDAKLTSPTGFQVAELPLVLLLPNLELLIFSIAFSTALLQVSFSSFLLGPNDIKNDLSFK